MAVEAVNNVNTKNKTCLMPMAQGAAVGAVIGYGLKYAYPLNADEKATQEYVHVIDKINNTKKSFSPWTRLYIDEIGAKANKTVAEDAFVKAYDGLKDGEKIGKSRILGAFREVQEKQPVAAEELKRLFYSAKLEAEKMAKKSVQAYNLATKHFRPTGFFVTTGAIVGATVALIHDVLKTDVKN